MNIFIEYLIQNWILILILAAFAIMLLITVFLDKRTVRRLYILIGVVFVLSIIVFIEFVLAENNQYPIARSTMIAIRYSATPIILALMIFTLVKRMRWYVLIPSFVFAIVNIVSIFTGIVFSINESGDLVRGVLGYLPYIGVGLYSVFLVYILIKRSNKSATEIIPIVFLAVAFASGLVLPFVMGKEYSKIFCPTIAIALFVYYVFLILQLTKEDALTGLFNRQAFYDASNRYGDITSVISIDMNGLKAINDNEGHIAGDEALLTLALCFKKSVRPKQSIYRIGGDEFVILCRKTKEEELKRIVKSIRKNVDNTKYTCSIGYSYIDNGKSTKEMIKESDEMMYLDKAKFYSESGIERRKN